MSPFLQFIGRILGGQRVPGPGAPQRSVVNPGSELQSVLLAIFQAATVSNSVTELFGKIHGELAKLIDTSNLYLALYDESTGLYSFPYHIDQYEADEQPPQALTGSLTDYVRRTGEPLLADEAVHQQLIASGEVELVGVPSPIWLGVPLKQNHKAMGVLAVQSYHEGSLYSEADLKLLSFVAETIALVVVRKSAELELRTSEKRFRDLFEASPDGIFVEDLDGVVLDVNPAGCALQGIERQRLIGMNVAQLVPEQMLEETTRNFDKLARGKVERVEGLTLTGDGREVPVELRATQIDYLGSPALLIHVRDVTERKEHERQLEQMARFDALTGLPNRSLFEDRMRRALREAKRAGQRVALHYLDLDEFKNINDTVGHVLGDELLKQAATRLEAQIRAEDSVARLGGDEFAIIQPGIQGPAGASAFALRLLDAMARPFPVNEHEIHTSTSIGIALSSDDTDPGSLMVQADRALYKAKAKGRNSFQFHDDKLAEEVERYVALRTDFGGALDREEFFLEYQPQVDLGSGRIVGAEALVRWQHPQRGLLYPGAFIPVTENTSLIVQLGVWVLNEACRQSAAWRLEGLGSTPVAINLSAVQFRDPRFISTLDEALGRWDIAPGLLELELTETVLMQGSEEVREALTAANQRGVSIAIDDFGTGYSSLRYLREFPVHRLKIAMEFVQGVTVDIDDEAIVEAVISLGHKLGKTVIAEGVESAEQAQYLRAQGCEQAQGYLFSKPVVAEKFGELLSTQAESAD